MYFLREALRNFYRHRRVDAVAVVVIATAMLLVDGVALVYVNFRNFSTYWGSQVHMVIYLHDTLTPERLEALRNTLSHAPEAASLEYTSKEQAMQQLRARLGEGAKILEGLQTNPLPASFTVTIREEFRRPELLRESVERYKRLPEIEEIDYGERWLERFHTLVSALEIGMIAVAGVMGVAVMFIIATTVRLALHSRAEEIEIMQLVGATLWFIKLPFFLEGVLQGMLGASLAVGLCYGLFAVLMNWVKPMGELFFDFSLLQFLPLPMILSLLLAGAVLGGVGSLFSLKRRTSPA
jgi:cell division transport system permease protein